MIQVYFFIPAGFSFQIFYNLLARHLAILTFLCGLLLVFYTTLQSFSKDVN